MRIKFANPAALTFFASSQKIGQMSLSDLILNSNIENKDDLILSILKGTPVSISKLEDFYITWCLFPFEEGYLLIGMLTHQINNFSSIQEGGFIDNLVNHLPHFVFWKNKHSVFMGCNKHFLNSTGFSEIKDIIGKTDYDMPWKESAEKFIEDDLRVITSGVPIIDYEETQVYENGEERIMLVSKVPLYNQAKNEATGILCIYTDITEKKQIEQTLQKVKYQLEGATLVSASIAHELRTPLATAKASIFIVNKIINKATRELENNKIMIPNITALDIMDLKESIRLISKKTDECNTIINMFLTKLKDDKKQSGNYRVFSVVKCIKLAISEYFKNEISDKIKLIQDKEFKIFGDMVEIKHIIMNLLKNAIFYIKKSGKGEITIWLEKADNVNKIHFKDTAMGVKESVLPKIFDPLFTTEHSTGSGVGLWFCKEAMRTHQGKIECLSKEGEYTEFVLSFPKLSMGKK